MSAFSISLLISTLTVLIFLSNVRVHEPNLAVCMCKCRSPQPLLAASQVHPQQLTTAGELQVWRDRQSDVRAGHVAADDQVSRRFHNLQSTRGWYWHLSSLTAVSKRHTQQTPAL